MFATLVYLGLFAAVATAWIFGRSDVPGYAVGLAGGAAALVYLT